MEIKDFDIWYTYTTFFIKDNLNLDKIARNLIQMECAQVVMSSDRKVIWKNNKELKEEKMDVKGDFNEYQVKFPEGIEEVKGGIEFTFQGVQMFIHSQNLFKDYIYGDTFNHIRVYCSPFYLHDDDFTISLYPQIKIFSSGIIQILFRKIGDLNEAISLNHFINNYLELPILSFKELWVPKGIQTLTSYYSINEDENKFKTNQTRKNEYTKINNYFEKIKGYSSDEFRFELVKLPMDTLQDDSDLGKRKIFTLEYILDLLLETVDIATNTDFPKNLKIKRTNSLSGHWKGTRNIFLLEYENQPDVVGDFNQSHKDALNKLMNITTNDLAENNDFKDLRMFKDYSLLVNETQLLWIMGRSGNISLDVNRGDIIYDKQITGEMLIYRQTLYEKLNFLSNTPSIPTLKVIELREELSRINQLSTNLGSYGEIRKLIKSSDKLLGIDTIKSLTEESLIIKKEKAGELKTARNNKFMILITVIVGLFGSTSLATGFFQPVLETFRETKKDIWISTVFPHIFSILIFLTLTLIVMAVSFKRN